MGQSQRRRRRLATPSTPDRSARREPDAAAVRASATPSGAPDDSRSRDEAYADTTPVHDQGTESRAGPSSPVRATLTPTSPAPTRPGAASGSGAAHLAV